MNRSKKEQERLRKRQSRNVHNQTQTSTSASQAPSGSLSLQQLPCSSTPEKCATKQLVPSHSLTKNQGHGQLTQSNLTDTTLQIVQMVGDETTEITDDVIEAMLNLMKAQSTPENMNIGYVTPAEIRLYSTDPGAYVRKIPQNKDCVLIHPLTGHWVTSFYSKDTKTVKVYDSMRTENHYYEIRRQVDVLYGSEITSRMQYVPVQQQNYLPICGGMALAFATSVFFGTDPQTFVYNMARIRQHVQECLLSGSLQQFPVCNENVSTTFTSSSSHDQQNTWKPLLANYFDKQKLYQNQHKKTINDNKTIQTSAKKEPITNNRTSTSRVQKFRIWQSEVNKNIAKMKDKTRKQLQRNTTSVSVKSNVQIKDTLHHKSKRDAMSENEKLNEKVKNKQQHQEKRARMNKIEKLNEKVKNKQQHQEKRVQMNKTVKQTIQNKDKQQHQEKRARMCESRKHTYHQKDNQRKKDERLAFSDNDISENRSKDRKRKATVRATIFTKDNARLISDFHKLIKEGPTYICTCCLRLLYRRTVVFVNKNNYKKVAAGTLASCLSGKLSHGREYICYTCHKKLMTGKIPPQAHSNHLLPDKVPDILGRLCSLEVQLITKIIPFMKIVSLPRGAQHGLKGQVVLVPANLNKITTSLPRPSSESQIIALALKRRLTDKHSVQKQYIRPNYVNCALQYLKDNNDFYRDITFRTDWQSISENINPDLWSAVVVQTELNEHTESSFECSQQNQSNLQSVDSSLKNDTLSTIVQQPASADQPVKCQTDKDAEDIIDSEDEIEEETPVEFLTDLQFKRTVNSDTCIQPVNGIEVKTSDVLNLAPAEGQTPVSISKEPYWEAMAFPTLFPTGVNTYSKKEPRPTKLTAKQYVNCRLLSCDSRFAESPEYTFAALDWLERETIKQTISISTRKCFHKDISVKQLRDPQNISKLLTENQIFAAFKSVRGSPQYFKNMHLDMLAKLRQLGPYTFFITGSAAEFHWPEVIQVVAHQYGETLTENDIANMNWETKRNWLQRNPVTVARHIDYIFEQLWGKVLLSGTHPVGQILNYDLRKEMQGRGTAHFHSAVHILGAPVLDKDPDHTFTEFADKHISCSLPNKDEDPDLFYLVQTRQTHHHTRTCTRRKGVACRFSFPKPPSDTTVIARVPDNTTQQNENNTTIVKDMAINILGKMYQYLTTSFDKLNPCTLDNILSVIGVSKQDYKVALTVSQRRTRIVMKRSPQDIFVNNYNPIILKCLRSNMDIQMITSIWACIAYITSYICKPEKTMSELMRKASKESADQNIKDRMYHIANQLRKGREVSHHEAIMRVLSIPLRRSNIPVSFISTDYKENRTRILKSKSTLDCLEDDDNDIYVPGMHEKYAARPSNLEHLCLAEFAANYVTASYTKNEHAEDINECDADQTAGVIKLKNNLGQMKKRQTPQVIRYHYISKENDPEQYHHRLLLLYKPWRREEDLKIDTYTQSFKTNQSEIINTIKKYEPFHDEVDSVIEHFDPEELLPEAWEQVAAQTEQEKLENTFTVIDPAHTFLDPENITSDKVTTSKSSARNFSLTSTVKHDDTFFYQKVTSLNEKQRKLFDFTYQWGMETRLSPDPPSPFYIFLSGGGGVGKTHLINTVYQGLIRVLRTPGQNPDLPTVLLTASTGKAAANISGTTLHSAFALPVKDSLSKNQYRKPSPEKLNSLRASYTNLKVIIADEISMFGAQSLNNLSLCLQDIFQDYTHPFAHRSVLAVGDLLQLNPVGDSPVFKTPKGGYEALAGSLWQQFFQLYELTHIVRQQGDPEFAEILSRVRVGSQTEQDIHTLKQLEQTSLETFPQNATHIVLTNEQADMYNQEVLKQFKNTVTFTATDSKRDKCTNMVPVTIQNNSLYQTGNLPKQITIAEKCAVMITKNVDIPDHLVNGTIGTVEKILIQQGSSLSGTVFVNFPLECVGQAAKQRSPPNLKHCVPIEPITSSFFLAKECPVPVERKMFPLVLAFAITSHKSQGSTYEYCIADLAKSPKMRTLAPGQAYTILSRVTSRKGLLLKNFSQESIVVNKAAVAEMERMRANSYFTWNHPLSVIAENDFIIAFLNIRSLNCHHKDLKSEKFLNKVAILCVCESHVKNITPFTIDGFHLFGKDTEHGLAIYVKHGLISTSQSTTNQIQVMARTFFLPYIGRLNVILAYKQPNLGNIFFFKHLITEVQKFDSNTSKLVIGGDFNTNDDHLLSSHGFQQHIHQSTHIQGGMIDHVYSNFDTHSGVFPLPYTDHFLTWIVLPQ